MRLLTLLLIVIISIYAKDNRYKLSVSTSYITNFESQIKLADKRVPIGVFINSKDQLGLKSDTFAYRGEFSYYFNPKHSIHFIYFSLNSRGLNQINKNLPIEDVVVSAGAKLTSHFDLDVGSIYYGYSFYKSDKVELMLHAGTHISRVSVGIGASGEIKSSDGNVTIGSSYSTSTAVTLPLPVIGFGGSYMIIKNKFFVHYTADYFALKISQYKGSYLSNGLGLEYYITKNFSAMLGFEISQIFLTKETDTTISDFENHLSGFTLSVGYSF